MMHGLARAIGAVILATAGCAGVDLRPTPAAPPVSSSSSSSSSALAQVSHVAAHNAGAVQRVEQTSRRILAANPQIAFRPAFIVTGDDQPQISHREDRHLLISEGLVKQCQTDGQLAAVLSLELAKMVVERQAKVGAVAQAIDREPPAEVRIGPDAGRFGEADEFRKAELHKLGQDRRKPVVPAQAVDPRLLAREYFQRAGYAQADWTAAAAAAPAPQPNIAN